jgi:tRNA A37 threonylcarbamoyladenosine modification protein TsaB
MPEYIQNGTWLLIDAAGPALVTGFVHEGAWQASRTNTGGFLESLKPDLEALLRETGLKLSELTGCLYAAGPGSTLGLRLAAMFVKGLMQLPALGHWQCLSYNNLSLACAGQLDPDQPQACSLLAPWRRDRLHLVEFDPREGRFLLSATDPESVSGSGPPCVLLGNRAPRLPQTVTAVPYPADRIPEILSAFPGLLVQVAEPALYTAEETEFARWSAERHVAP